MYCVTSLPHSNPRCALRSLGEEGGARYWRVSGAVSDNTQWSIQLIRWSSPTNAVKPFTSSRITLSPGEVIKCGNLPLCNFPADCNLTVVWKRYRDGALPIRWPLLPCIIIPTLFAYSLVPRPSPQLSSLVSLVACSTNNALFVLQATIAVVEDWERG